jgi:hypothetical protein
MSDVKQMQFSHSLHFLKQYETLHAEKLQNDSESDIAWG